MTRKNLTNLEEWLRQIADLPKMNDQELVILKSCADELAKIEGLEAKIDRLTQDLERWRAELDAHLAFIAAEGIGAKG